MVRAGSKEIGGRERADLRRRMAELREERRWDSWKGREEGETNGGRITGTGLRNGEEK